MVNCRYTALYRRTLIHTLKAILDAWENHAAEEEEKYSAIIEKIKKDSLEQVRMQAPIEMDI